MRTFVVLCITLLMAGSAALADVTFTPISLPSGWSQLRLTGISPDGAYVTGYGTDSSYNQNAVLWTADGGLVNMGGILTGGTYASGMAVSNNGVVAGKAYDASYSYEYGFMKGQTSSRITFGSETALEAINADATVGAGTAQGPGMNYAARYNSNGTTQLLQPLAAGAWAGAFDISADGSAIAGYSRTTASGYTARAVIWNGSSAPVSLGTLSGNASDSSYAKGISADGTYVVGTSQYKPFIWSEASGMQALEMPTDYYGPDVSAVADNGMAVGMLTNASYQTFAAAWNADGSLLNLNEMLADAGLLPSGWRPYQATDISADGSTLVGFGYNAQNQVEGFVMTVPVPEPATMGLLAFGAIALIRRRR